MAPTRRRHNDSGNSNSDNTFTIKFHHGGELLFMQKELVYHGGSVEYLDNCELDELSLLDFDDLMEDLGYVGLKIYFWRTPRKKLGEGLVEIKVDSDVLKLGAHISQEKVVEVFVKHMANSIEGEPGDEQNVDNKENGFYESDNDISGEDDDLLQVFVDCGIVKDRSQPTNENLSQRQDPLYQGQGERKFDSTKNHMIVQQEIEETSSEYALSEELFSASSSDDNADHSKVRWAEFNDDMDMSDPMFEKGMLFKSFEEFKVACKQYSIVHNLKIRFGPNDKQRVQAKCKSGCPWRIWVGHYRNESTVQIKTLVDMHTCSKEHENRYANYKYLGTKYLSDFTADPNWSVSGLQNRVRQDLQLEVPRMTAWRAKQHALKKIQGSEEEQYASLQDYCEEIMRTNPRSRTILGLDNRLFQKMYVCLQACRDGFLAGCRQLIGVDGCWLKGRYGGQMLVAVGIDPNDCIFPIAYAVVEREDKESWGWFLERLYEDLGIENQYHWSFISDKQKGLRIMLEEMFPESEHRCCVRHMYNNFRDNGGHKGKLLKDLFWNAARATFVADFDRWMRKINRLSPSAHDWLHEKPYKHWSRSHFSTIVKSDMLLNNICECFNKYILDARDKPILTMMEMIRCKLMKRLWVKREAMKKHTGLICPKIQKKFDKAKEQSFNCIPRWSGGKSFQVNCSIPAFLIDEVDPPNTQFVVDLEAHECSCRKWQLTGLPCSHAISCIYHEKLEPESFVDDCYSTNNYLKAYGHIIHPINGKQMWPKSGRGSVIPPPLPEQRKGRKQKVRRKEPEEKEKASQRPHKISKHGGKMTCSICGKQGHNKRFHGAKSNSKNAREKLTVMRNQSHNQVNSSSLGQEPTMIANQSSHSRAFTVRWMTEGTSQARGSLPNQQKISQTQTSSHNNNHNEHGFKGQRDAM